RRGHARAGRRGAVPEDGRGRRPQGRAAARGRRGDRSLLPARRGARREAMTDARGSGPRTILEPEFLRKPEPPDFAAQKVLAGLMAGERRASSRLLRGTLFREHRPMTPGDDLRYVDWNVYARLHVPYVKEFEPEESLEVALFVDTSLSMSLGDPEKFSYSRSIAAAFAFVA